MNKNMFYLIISILLLFSQVSYTQWVQVTDGLEDFGDGAFAIDACDSNTIVFSATSRNGEWPEIYRIFLTSNGGETWGNIKSPINLPFEDISIIDSLHIWGAVSNGQIYSTSDGGINWTLQVYDTTLTKFMNYIEMFDLNNGIAMGDALDHENDPAVFLKTTDGGNSWISVNDSSFGGVSGDAWRRVDFINLDVGFFLESGKNPQGLYKTLDGCQTWESLSFSGAITNLKFFNNNIGLLYDINEKAIQQTLDGGTTWNSFVIDSAAWGNDIEFLPNDPSKVWFTDFLSLYYSVDTGRTWTKQVMPKETIEGRDIVFTDENNGWLLCNSGYVYRTTNNGGIVTAVEKEKTIKLPSEFSLSQNYPNPFNPSTSIKYEIPNAIFIDNRTIDGIVSLKISNVLGKEIKTLVNKKHTPGSYEVNFDASNLTSGIYFYRLQSGNFVETKKMIFLK